MNVDRRGVGTSKLRIRFLAAGLVLFAAGCLVLGGSSHSRIDVAKSQSVSPSGPMAAASLIPAADLNAGIQLAEARRAASDRAGASLAGTNLSGTNLAGTNLAAKHLSQKETRNLLSGLPLMFEPNQGQGNLDAADPRAKFIAHGSGYSLFLGEQGAILGLVSPKQELTAGVQPRSGKAVAKADAPRIELVQMKLAGANAHPTLSGADLLPSVSNYIVGNNPAGWRRGISQFARVRYADVYPGINLLFYGNQGHLEYDFQVAPGSDPAQAELEFDGAKQLELQDGALVIKTAGRSMRLEAPSIYQQIDGRRQTVAGGFVLRGSNRAGFAVGTYDHSRELVIDPVLSFSSYFGGSGNELNTTVAVDTSGNVYLAGSTTSTDLPTVSSAFQPALKGTQNVYIAKIAVGNGNPASLQYVTYLGGNGTDTPVGIEVDGAGEPFVAGTTTSTNFPTTQTAYQTVPAAGSAGTQHVFATELNNAASVAQGLLYSTYLSGSGNDIASGMAIDAKGDMFITGTTSSVNPQDYAQGVQFPVTSLPQPLPFQQFPRSPIVQFFVTEVNTLAPKNSSIAYSTYFGGGNFFTTNPIATGGGVAVDSNGNIYFSGTTNFTFSGCAGCQTSDFPILNAYQPCLDQSPPVVIVNPPVCSPSAATSTNSDAFLAKINPIATQGLQLIWSSYVGGSDSDTSTGIALDSGAANVFIVGTTNSPDVTTSTTFFPFQQCLDTAVNPGTGTPCTPPAQPAATDAYVARFPNLVPSTTTTNTNLSLTYFTYLGGSGNDSGLAITIDASDGAVITGWTQSADFPVAPTPNDIQSVLNGPQDAFIARVNSSTVSGQNTIGTWANYFGGSGSDEGTGVAIDTNGAIYVSGDTNSADFPTDRPIQAANNGGSDSFVTQLTSASSLSISGVLTLGTNQTYISAGSPATFTYTLTNQGPDLANSIVVNDNITQQDTFIPLSFVSASATTGTCGGGSTSSTVSCNIPSLQSGSTATITIVLTPTASASGGSAKFNGGTVSATAANNTTAAETSVSAQMSDFSVALNPPNASVPVAGDTATYQVQLTPQPIFDTNISLAVTGTPAGTTAIFTTNPVTLQGSSPGATTLNITTTVRPIPIPQTASLFLRHAYALWLPLPGLAMIVFAASGKRRSKRVAGWIALWMVLSLVTLLPSCSGTTQQTPASGTPAGTYTLTLTATSGGDSKSQSFLLTVP